MKKRIIYLLMAAIGTVGFTGCGPGQNTNQDRTGTYDNRTGTQMGTQTGTTGNTVGTTTGTTGNRTATTGTSGTRNTTTTGTAGTTTTGTAGTTTSNTGQRSADNNATTTGNMNNQNRNDFRLNQTTDYSYNNENYRFTPDARGVNITRDQNGTQTPYGSMRSFGDDGYYIVTTTNALGEEEVSVGVFDERGNFTIYRYDRDGDRVTEQNYRSNTPVNRNNR